MQRLLEYCKLLTISVVSLILCEGISKCAFSRSRSRGIAAGSRNPSGMFEIDETYFCVSVGVFVLSFFYW